MTTHISNDLLDLALSRLQQGDSAADILAAYPTQPEALRPLLQTAVALDALRPVHMPTYEAMVSDRNDFLAQVTELQLQPVSPNPLVRLKDWIFQHRSRSSSIKDRQQKEIPNMSALVIKVALVLAFAFSSLGGSLVAAADSLPNSVLYPLKLAVEEAQLAFRNDPADQASLHLAFAQERAQEMARLAAKGDVPQEAMLNQLQTHMRTAYHLAAQTSDEKMERLLTQARDMTLTQERRLEQAQEKTNEQAQNRLQEASNQMAFWQQEAEDGLLDPQQFRHQYQHRLEDGPGPCVTDCEPPVRDQLQDQSREQNQIREQDQQDTQQQNREQNRDQEQQDTQQQNRDQYQEKNQEQNREQQQNQEQNQIQDQNQYQEQNQNQYQEQEQNQYQEQNQNQNQNQDQEQNQNQEQNQYQNQNQDQEQNQYQEQNQNQNQYQEQEQNQYQEQNQNQNQNQDQEQNQYQEQNQNQNQEQEQNQYQEQNQNQDQNQEQEQNGPGPNEQQNPGPQSNTSTNSNQSSGPGGSGPGGGN